MAHYCIKYNVMDRAVADLLYFLYPEPTSLNLKIKHSLGKPNPGPNDAGKQGNHSWQADTKDGKSIQMSMHTVHIKIWSVCKFYKCGGLGKLSGSRQNVTCVNQIRREFSHMQCLNKTLVSLVRIWWSFLSRQEHCNPTQCVIKVALVYVQSTVVRKWFDLESLSHWRKQNKHAVYFVDFFHSSQEANCPKTESWEEKNWHILEIWTMEKKKSRYNTENVLN